MTCSCQDWRDMTFSPRCEDCGGTGTVKRKDKRRGYGMRLAAFFLGIWTTLIITLLIKTVNEGDDVGIYILVVAFILTTIVAFSILKRESE